MCSSRLVSMRSSRPLFLLVVALLCGGEGVRAQAPRAAVLGAPQTEPPSPPAPAVLTLEPAVPVPSIQLAAAQAGGKDDKNLSKQVEILRKQVETQQKMIELLAEQARKQPPVDKLQQQVVTLEGRSQQAARRDQDLAQGVDNLTEHLDAAQRNGPRLPATLKQLFLPSETNQTPLSIYGTFNVLGYTLFPHTKGEGKFAFNNFEPRFLLQLNDNVFMLVEPEFTADAVDLGEAYVNFIVNDNLALVAGRFLPPIGSFNERLHFGPVRKMPDFPVSERTVTPGDFSLNGVQARGATYLFGSPFKLEYGLYAGNGLGLPGKELSDLANLDALAETTADANNSMAWGGRVGLWQPEWGFNGGFSLFFNRPYRQQAGTDINLWNVDLNYHKGNWDLRFEYAFMFEKTAPFLGNDIHRRGFYAQVAYRPHDAKSDLLRKTEFVFRYSQARFQGIDPLDLDIGSFASKTRAPVNRDQYAVGVNYYIAPMLFLQFAYEFNREHGINLKDDVFLAALTWGF